MGPKTADNKGAELNDEVEKLFEMDNREGEQKEEPEEESSDE